MQIDEDDENQISSEGEGEDLMENMEKDYEPKPELDDYEEEGLDEGEYSEMDAEERKKADEEMYKRDVERMKESGRLPRAVIDEYEFSDEEEQLERRKMRTHFKQTVMLDDEEYKDTENYLNREDVKGKSSQWLRELHVINYVKKTFSRFIRGYKEGDLVVYEQRIKEAGLNNLKSLEVNYTHLSIFNSFLGKWVIEHPDLILPHLNEMAFLLSCEIFPNYENISPEMFVRIKDTPVTDNLRDLRQDHLDLMVKVKGVVTKRSNVMPKLKKATYFCIKCEEKKGPFWFNGDNIEIELGSCVICQTNGPFKLDQYETVYKNYQKIVIQESPGSVPPGRLPRHKEVYLLNDLVESVRPGDEVEVTGIYKSIFNYSTNAKHSFPAFNTYLEANHIARLNELEATELTEEDKFEIRKLAKHPNIVNMVFKSIAPSIYGHEFIKRALALAMFGGESKDVQGKHRIRGDINVLLLGDPGVAKSQFLKYVQKVFHRSIYTTGKGASAVGLTAGVHRDIVDGEWKLEGGALVLADRGICLIDEFDKMNDQDRTSIHEAMEQQSISISKAGIVCTLQARCSVIAAANPVKGRYDNALTFADNVNLTEPILSRFDILCVVKDEVEINTDTSLSTFVLNSHIKSHPEYEESQNSILLHDPIKESQDKEIIPQDLLRKYIMYARKFVHPKNSELNKNKVAKFYAELRKESEAVGGMSIAVRHLESLLRIAEAHAKIRLNEQVKADDIDFAIKMMLESFLMSQKTSINKGLRGKFKNYLTQFP